MRKLELKYAWVIFLCCSFTKAVSLDMPAIDSDVYRWTDFIGSLQSQTGGKIPPPFSPVKLLAEKYLQPNSAVLDIGCETGKNAACLIENGHKVILLDIAPNALFYTIDNLSREGLNHGILDSFNVKIEELNYELLPFQAVVGTYVFSFIPPELFEDTMTKKVFDHIEVGGYFAGGFFGEQHDWAHRPGMSILSLAKLETLFSCAGFKLIEVSEVNQKFTTVSEELTQFHTFDIIAQKISP